jgi:predicted NBD/HSP70 family sugar kinase
LVANITSRNLSFARVDLAGNITLRRDIPIKNDNSAETIIPIITKNLSELLAAATTLGIGIALPGIIDPHRGLCIQAVNLNRWRNIPIGSILSDQLDSPIIVDNDVRCQLHAFTWFGHMSRNAENVLYIFIHNGVSCAMMSRGQIIIGERFTAGEIGHTKAGSEGRLCACGRLDCLETYCSLPAIIAEIKTVQPEIKIESASDITAAARTTPAIDNILDRVTNRLARSITGIVAATDPAALVLGTADREFSESLRPHLRRHLYTEMIGLHSGDAKITTAGNADTETLRGIAARVIRRAFRGTPPANDA